MLRALIWKEWRQLRALRWTGIGLGLVLPPALIAGAEASRRGWLFGETVRDYSFGTILADVMPALMGAALWPLLALMFAAQAYAGDRGSGTENFLLERPVARSRVWQARGLAALGSALGLFGIHVALWLAAVATVGPGLSDFTGRPFFGGLFLASVCFVAGVCAASFVASPMQAMLLGLVLAAVPVGLSALVRAMTYGLLDERVNWAIASFPLLGYVATSLLVTCRGEPLGRGRMQRGLVALAITLGSVPVVLGFTATPILRWSSARNIGNAAFFASPSADVALLVNHHSGGAWIIGPDPDRTRFLTPFVFAADWNADGSRLAILRSRGRFGTRELQVEIRDASGRPVGDPIECGGCRGFAATPLRWSGEYLLVATRDDTRGEGLAVISSRTGKRRDIALSAGNGWAVTATGLDGKPWLVRRGGGSTVAAVHSVDTRTAALGPALEIPGRIRLWNAERCGSPSGRFWVNLPTPGESEGRTVIDLQTGARIPGPATHPTWVGHDEMAWVEQTAEGVSLLRGAPGAEPRTLRSWPGEARGGLELSPDGTRLLVVLYWPESEERSVWLYDVATDGWTDLTGDLGRVRAWFTWAGPGRLALVHRDGVAGYDLEGGGVNYPIGSAPP